MLNTNFSVDMSVWQDGVTFHSAAVSKPAAEFALPKSMRTPSFREEVAIESTKEKQQEQAIVEAKQVQNKMPAPVSLLPQNTAIAAQTAEGVVDLPSALADVEDLTPFIVSADSKPGTRLEEELDRTTFTRSKGFATKDSPYNMSEKRAKAREASLAGRPLKGPGDSKLFPMNTASRFTGDRSVLNAPTLDSTAAKAHKEASSSSAKASENQISSVDVNAIRAQTSSGGFGYNRDNLPSASNEKTSAAASWFPEAMTRQLDMYEAANKVAAQGGAAIQNPLNIKA